MQNIKINGVPTRYWCVVVPVDAEIDSDMYFCGETLRFNFSSKSNGNASVYTGLAKASILGCITLSSMDEGVRELARKNEVFELYMDYMNNVFDTFRFRNPHESSLSLLQHNQITLTAATKAVVVKQVS